MAAQLLLVGRFASPHVRRVAITLRLLDKEFEHLPLSPLAGLDPIRPWNPVGRVPVLRASDGELLVESSAIIDYLLETYGSGSCLLPARGAERRMALQIVAWANTALEKATYAGYELIKRPEEKRHPPIRDTLLEQGAAALARAEALMTPTALPARESELSLAGLTASVAYEFIGRFQPDIIERAALTELPRLSQACEALPSFSRCTPEK